MSYMQFILLFALIIGLSVFSQRYVEAPFRDRDWISRRNVFRASFAGLVAIFAIGLVGNINKGFEARISEDTKWRELAVEYPHKPFHNAACDTNFPQFKTYAACLKSRSEAPEILLLGDSHAQHFYKSLAAALPKKSVMNLSHWSCLPFASRTHQNNINGCPKIAEDALAFVEQTASIDLVVIAGFWGYLSTGGLEKNNGRQDSHLIDQEIDSFVAAADAALKRLSSTGKRVIIFNDTPDMGFDITKCFDMRPYRTWQPKDVCGIPKSDFDSKYEKYENLISNLVSNYPSVEIFDTAPAFCGDEYCRAVMRDTILYVNPDHLTVKGADLVIENFLEAFRIAN